MPSCSVLRKLLACRRLTWRIMICQTQNRDCQRAHWKMHKLACASVAEKIRLMKGPQRYLPPPGDVVGSVIDRKQVERKLMHWIEVSLPYPPGFTFPRSHHLHVGIGIQACVEIYCRERAGAPNQSRTLQHRNSAYLAQDHLSERHSSILLSGESCGALVPGDSRFGLGKSGCQRD